MKNKRERYREICFKKQQPAAHTHTHAEIPPETAPEFTFTVLHKSYF